MENNSNVTLKPCPFCGFDCITYGYVRDGQSLGCGSCGVKLVRYHSQVDDTNARLATAWNTRNLLQVKPLVWEDSTQYKHSGSVEYAETPFGTYFIIEDNDDFTGLYCKFVTLREVTWFGTGSVEPYEIMSHVYEEEATKLRAAAQADYNNRILGELATKETL